jgi:hypothetical protein
MNNDETISPASLDEGALKKEKGLLNTRMILQELITDNEIELDEKVRLFCEEGFACMQESTDPVHGIGHIQRIIKTVIKFAEDNPSLRIDFSVLLPAIAWHDVWRASNFKPNLVRAVHAQFFEGQNADKLVRTKMKEKGFDQAFIEKVTYCVRVHPGVYKGERKTLESKILNDLDELDSWAPERLQEIKAYLTQNRKGRMLLPLLKRATGVIISKANHTYYFESVQRERDRRFPEFAKQVKLLFG